MRRWKLFAMFLLFTETAHGFVFSCDEIKYKLLDTNLEVSTRYVCLTAGNAAYYDSECLSHIFVRSDHVSTSFPSLLNSTCINSPGDDPWTVVSNPNAHCPPAKFNDLALIFTSSRPKINVVQFDPSPVPSTTLKGGDEQIFSYPETGIFLHKQRCTGSGNVTVFTGAGRGENEHRFLMKSWRCVDLPDWIISFDDVITVAVDSNVEMGVEYSKQDQMMGMDVTPADRIAVMSSGRSDNPQNSETGLAFAHNYVKFNVEKKFQATASCKPCSFDPNDDGFLRMTAYNGNVHDTKEAIVNTEGNFNIDFGFSLNVEYVSDASSPKDIWDRDDNFVIEFTFTDPDVQITTEHTITTDFEMLTTDRIVENADPYCGCGLDAKFGQPLNWNPNEIWLDVVIILDTSEAMGQVALVDASTLIESLFGTDEDDLLTTNTDTKFFTRIGLIAMSNETEVLYNLNMTKADTVFDKVNIQKGVMEIEVISAFNAALVMFNDGLVSIPDRVNTRQVIYYMTDSNPKVDLTPLNQFKTSQGIIIVNNFLEPGEMERPGLKNLASDGYYRSDIQKNYMETIQLFCKANCFCKADRSSYEGHSSDPSVKASGGCFHAAPVGVQFTKAISNCAKLGDGGLIASVHDDHKAAFMQQVMSKVAPKSSYVWIGYSKTDETGWSWEDQSTDPYTNWGMEEPSSVPVSKCAYLDMTSPGLNWGAGNCNVGFPSVCEFAPCSVGHKC